ncbi:MAG: tRNA (adenosine(37)-N6)-threonylcarbamoyltransferase complex dimerization subunit type 1 TsaB [Clostridiales bacterium]|jgi:tRNA threonylcarbamoyladenosine biosynthesis protein TsaB|nr:tRNA (adenosine(37)-N6)-threonylcarbamoyltransferase complex dimerization subunit type 1 TsaB [Eubacteriales bacterium]MDH7566919.1 tRNA (adenosine(37)-N6)-threonylcarbamoyltransferase complex dimerization subunit type 1 TsaB [Clostridiales bacterium]
MKILAVDTSSTAASVAIVENTKLMAEYTLNHAKTHSQKLMPMVKELMDELGLKPEDVDIYAASSGPGSFTGLRIGITTVKALAYATQKPVVSVPTLDALAYNIPLTDSIICPVMDARNNQVYTALYKWEKNIQVKVTEYMGIDIMELLNLIKGRNQKVLFLGDAVHTHCELLKKELPEKCGFAQENLWIPRASSVGSAAFLKAAAGKLESCFDMVPFYLRKSQAEREFDKRAESGRFLQD